MPPGVWIERGQVRFARACLRDGAIRWYILGPDTLVPEGRLVAVDVGGRIGSDRPPGVETKLVTKHVADRVVRHRNGPAMRYVLAEFS